MPDQTDIEKLKDVIDELPDKNDFTGSERREYSLTKGDVLLIYKIAMIANKPHICPFVDEELDTLKSVAKNISKSQKIATSIIITGCTVAIFSGIWVAVKHAFLEWVKVGK